METYCWRCEEYIMKKSSKIKKHCRLLAITNYVICGHKNVDLNVLIKLSQLTV